MDEESGNIDEETSDETQHDRHHKFTEDPEKVYKENHLMYCFGTKYITPEGFEYLQNILDRRMCTNKFLPGMGGQYFKFVTLKKAVVLLIFQLTGLPYDEADKMCSVTELSFPDYKKDKI